MIEAEHLLYALVSDKEGIVVSMLEKLGASPAASRPNWRRNSPRCPK